MFQVEITTTTPGSRKIAFIYIIFIAEFNKLMTRSFDKIYIRVILPMFFSREGEYFIQTGIGKSLL
jgi:hypothetical protein